MAVAVAVAVAGLRGQDTGRSLALCVLPPTLSRRTALRLRFFSGMRTRRAQRQRARARTAPRRLLRRLGCAPTPQLLSWTLCARVPLLPSASFLPLAPAPACARLATPPLS